MMFSINKFTVALFAISSCNILLGESSMKSELDSINKQLVATVTSTDFEENLKAIKQLFDEKLKKTPHRIPFGNFGSKALETLVSLAEIRCDERYFNDLKRINDALENEAHRKDQPIRRISRVVHDLSMKHAKNCPIFYYKAFEAKVANQDQDLVNNVKTFYNSMVDAEKYGERCWIQKFTSAANLFTEIMSGYRCSWWDKRFDLWNVLKLFTKDSDDSKYLEKIDHDVNGRAKIDQSKLRPVFEEHLVKPCKYYTSHFGSVFAPAMYDAEMHHEVDESKPEFYFGMAYYRLCNGVLFNEQDIFENLLRSQNLVHINAF